MQLARTASRLIYNGIKEQMLETTTLLLIGAFHSPILSKINQMTMVSLPIFDDLSYSEIDLLSQY